MPGPIPSFDPNAPFTTDTQGTRWQNGQPYQSNGQGGWIAEFITNPFNMTGGTTGSGNNGGGGGLGGFFGSVGSDIKSAAGDTANEADTIARRVIPGYQQVQDAKSSFDLFKTLMGWIVDPTRWKGVALIAVGTVVGGIGLIVWLRPSGKQQTTNVIQMPKQPTVARSTGDADMADAA